MYLSTVIRDWPVKNALNLLGVYLDLIIANDKSKVLNFHLFKLILFWSEVEVIVSKNFKDVMGVVPQVLLVVKKD